MFRYSGNKQLKRLKRLKQSEYRGPPEHGDCTLGGMYLSLNSDSNQVCEHFTVIFWKLWSKSNVRNAGVGWKPGQLDYFSSDSFLNEFIRSIQIDQLDWNPFMASMALVSQRSKGNLTDLFCSTFLISSDLCLFLVLLHPKNSFLEWPRSDSHWILIFQFASIANLIWRQFCKCA
jgi:hypothetical protein